MRYVSIDIETLGLDPNTCDIIEFGAVLDTMDATQSVDDLPSFQCYLTKPRDIYRGEVYAMYMHSKSKMFERIAKREEGFNYIPDDLLEDVFSEWLYDNGFSEDVKLNIAGKNFSGFDLPFLKKIGFGTKIKLNHRVLDPGSMCFDPTMDADQLPGLDECLKRCGFKKSVNHTAVDDARDVIRVIRASVGISEY